MTNSSNNIILTESREVRWDDAILDIGERTIDEIEKYGSKLCYKLGRQEIVVNRIWCKGLVKYLMRNKEWMAKEANAKRLRSLSNFTQQTRYYIAKDYRGRPTRSSNGYDRKIERIQQSGIGGDNLGWSDPYRLLLSVMFDNNLVSMVVGTTNFKYKDENNEGKDPSQTNT